MKEDDRIEAGTKAMAARRAELINQPLSRIYDDLFRAGITAYLAGDVVVPISKPHRFKTGDRVIHSGRSGEGVVTILDNGAVRVDFSGSKSQGIYDAQWFSMHPNTLTLVTASESQP